VPYLELSFSWHLSHVRRVGSCKERHTGGLVSPYVVATRTSLSCCVMVPQVWPWTSSGWHRLAKVRGQSPGRILLPIYSSPLVILKASVSFKGRFLTSFRMGSLARATQRSLWLLIFSLGQLHGLRLGAHEASPSPQAGWLGGGPTLQAYHPEAWDVPQSGLSWAQ
jgi:hypothetical protein